MPPAQRGLAPHSAALEALPPDSPAAAARRRHTTMTAPRQQPSPERVQAVAPAEPQALVTGTDARIAARLMGFALLAWFVSLGIGVALFDEDKSYYKRRREALTTISLPFLWFDHILRRYGGALPFAAIALRCGASLATNGPPMADAAEWRECMVVYLGLTVLRILTYSLHTAGYFAFLVRQGVVSALPQQLMSDHVFLCSSLVAITTCEVCLLVRDIRAARRLQAGRASLAALRGGLAAAGALLALTCADMLYTARYFHPPEEVSWAVLSGLVLFQVPAFSWLLAGRRLVAAGSSRM